MNGVLLLNIGGPDSLGSVRSFLFNLFSDRDIIKLPVSGFLQAALASVIATFRSKKVIDHYRMIGGKSPLIDITRNQAQALEKVLNDSGSKLQRGCEGGLRYKVYFAMRYSPPSIKDVVKSIMKEDTKSLIVLSLFPQYSKATTGSAFNEVKRTLNEIGFDQDSKIKITFIESWYDYPGYLDALSKKIGDGIKLFDNKEDIQVLFSAHSLPKSFIDDGDHYLRHIEATISGVLERLGLVHWHLGFQSRSGPVRWLGPETSKIIKRLAEEGHKEILIVPLSFVSDNFEILYEIDILYKKMAEEKGVLLKRTESLNTSPDFIKALGEIVIRNSKLQGSFL